MDYLNKLILASGFLAGIGYLATNNIVAALVGGPVIAYGALKRIEDEANRRQELE